MTFSKNPSLWQITSLLVVLTGGVLATYVGWQSVTDWRLVLAFVVILSGGLIIASPRQPEARIYAPRNFSTYILKWLSAPQIEAGILFWFGASLLTQPTQVSAYYVFGSAGASISIGWLFLVLGWLLISRLPNPAEYTAITSVRLLYTLVVVVDVIANNYPLAILGAYGGSILHGLVSMLVQWVLREVAEQVRDLKIEVRDLRQLLMEG